MFLLVRWSNPTVLGAFSARGGGENRFGTARAMGAGIYRRAAVSNLQCKLSERVV